MKLTTKQQACLDAIEECGWLRIPELARALGQSEQGAVSTASSLVRRGLVKRLRFSEGIAFGKL